MIVYVESNFILEIALEQEQLLAAESIMALAEKNSVKLAFPSFVLSEPFERLMRERRERNLLHNSLVKSLTNLQRSEPHKNIMRDMEPVIRILTEAHFKQLERLHSTVEKLLAVGECINVNAAYFNNALIYQQNLGFSPQDSIIYATVVADLQTRPGDEEKCFLSRDRKAFGREDDDRSIKTELVSYNCRYIGSFAQGLDYIQHTLQT